LTEEIVEGNKSVILFEASLRDQRAHGLDVVGYLPGGLVGELTVSAARGQSVGLCLSL